MLCSWWNLYLPITYIEIAVDSFTCNGRLQIIFPRSFLFVSIKLLLKYHNIFEKAPLGNWYLFIFETKNKKLVLLILDWMEYFIYDFQRGSKNIDSSKKDDDQVKLPQIRRRRPSHWRHCPCYAESKYLYVSLFVLGFFVCDWSGKWY